MLSADFRGFWMKNLGTRVNKKRTDVTLGDIFNVGLGCPGDQLDSTVLGVFSNLIL